MDKAIAAASHSPEETPPQITHGESDAVSVATIDLLRACPEATLLKRWDDALRRVNQPKLLQPSLESPDLRIVFGRYIRALAEQDPSLDGFAKLAWSGEVLTFLSSNTAAVIAALHGSGDFAPAAPRGDSVGIRSEAAIASELAEHAADPETHPLPSAIRAALPAAVPALVAAVLDEYRMRPPHFERSVSADSAKEHIRSALERVELVHSEAELFSSNLQQRADRIRALAADLVHRVVARGPRASFSAALEAGRLDEFKRLVPGKAANPFLLRHIARILAETPGADQSYESYLAEHSFGAARELNLASQIAVSDPFAEFPLLSDPALMDKGLTTPHRVTLRPANSLFHPYLLFHRGFAVPSKSITGGRDEYRRASLPEIVFGLSGETSKLLRQIALGEAAVVNLTEEGARAFFKVSVAPALSQGEVLDGGKQTVIQSLIESHIVRPTQPRGSGKAADLLRDQREQAVAKDPTEVSRPWATGPRALRLFLTALGADRIDLSDRLLHHSREAAKRLGHHGVLPRSHSAAASLAASQLRQDVVRNLFTTKTVMDVMTFVHVPVLRTPGLAPGEVLEKDADANFRLQREVADRALRLDRDYGSLPAAPDEVLAELQTLYGYMIMGRDAYQKLGLPYSRSVLPPDRLGPGIVESLTGKTGLIRSVFFGTRFDNSARLKLLPDWRQAVNSVKAPPYTVATLRGDYLRTMLLTPEVISATSTTPALQERVFLGKLAGVFARQTKNSDFAADLSKWAGGFLARIERDAGTEASASMRETIARFCATIPQPHQSEAKRLLLGETDVPGSFAARRFDQHLANAFLAHPAVAPLVQEVNDYYPIMLSRYPVIHHHSYVALFMRIGDAETNAFSIHPLDAAGIGGDYDGDAVDVMAPLPYSASPQQAAIWREMMFSHSPTHAVLNSASGTDLIYKFSLNASEGLVKANLCYVPAAGAGDHVIAAAMAESALKEVLPRRDELLRRMLSEPEVLLNIQGAWLRELRQSLGADAIPLSSSVAKSDGKATTLSRFFLHEVLRLVADDREALVEAALGPKFLAPGEVSVTSGKKVERLLELKCLPDDAVLRSSNPGDHIGAIFGAFYGYLSAEATTATQSAREGLINSPAIFAYVADHPLVAEIRALFQDRLIAIEQAHSRGLLTDAQRTTMLMRLEAGEKGMDEKADASKPGLGALLGRYRAVSEAELPAAKDALRTFILTRAADPAYGLKPLLKGAVQIACDEFARQHGYPHLLIEQVLTDRVKASEEVLYRFFMGTANVIDGDAVPTTFGGLVEAPTVERILKSGPAALDKAVQSKMSVPATGTAFKEYELLLSGVMVTDVGTASAESSFERFDVGRYAGSDEALDYLAHQLTLRRLRLAPSAVMTAEERAHFDERLKDAIEIVPFDRAALVKLIKEIHAADPHAAIEVKSVLRDRNFGRGVSAESVGYLPTAGPGGLRIDDQGRIRRVPFSETRCLGYPLGGILAGALGELATQSALRTRHITGSGVEEYSHLGDWHRVVHGPFPQRSPYYRVGGDEIRSISPLAYPGFEDCAVAVATSAKNLSNTELQVARERLLIAGVEVYPGERYRVINEKLVVGTDRPRSFALPVDDDVRAQMMAGGKAPWIEEMSETLRLNIEPVAASHVHFSLSRQEAASVGVQLEDTVADFIDTPTLGVGVSALAIGNTVRVQIPLAQISNVLDRLAGRIGLSPDGLSSRLSIPAAADYAAIPRTDAGRAQWAMLAERGVARYRVTGSTPANLGKSCPLYQGMIINPQAGLAVGSLDRAISSGLSGFKAYLGFISGKTLDTRAPLALATGTIDAVKYLAKRGESCDYEITISGNDGRVSAQVIRLPAHDVPCIVPGQQIERGRPLSFGAVSLAERSELRPDTAQRELAEFLMASSYGRNKRSPAPLITEILARSLFSSGRFTPIQDVAKDREHRIGENVWQLAGRSGKLETLLNAACSPQLSSGFGRVHAYPSPDKTSSDQLHPVQLFPSPHPMDMPHASALAERLAALGLSTKLLEPLVRTAKRLEKRAQQRAIPRAENVPVPEQVGASPTPMLDRG